MKSPKTNPRHATIFGVGIFLLLVIWALWHGVIGPRVIEPVPTAQPQNIEAPGNNDLASRS